MRASAVIRIIIYVVIAIVCITLLIGGLTGMFVGFKGFKGFKGLNLNPVRTTGGFDDSAYTVSSSGEIDAREINRINVDWVSGSIKIEEYDGSTVKFYEDSTSSLDTDYRMRYLVKDGILSIRFAKGDIFNIGVFTTGQKNLVIKVPKNISLDKLNVDTVSAPVEIERVKAAGFTVNATSGQVKVNTGSPTDQIRVDTVSGEVTVESVNTKSINVNTVSGNIVLVGSYEDIDLDTTSGAVRLECEKVFSSARVNTVSGSVNIYLPDNNGFEVRWDSVSGRFDCEFEVRQSGSSATYKEGGPTIRIDTVSGRMSIKKK